MKSLALALLVAATVSAQPASAASVIKRPALAKEPSLEDIARYYPDRAQRLEVTGQATIVCTVSAKLTMEGCAVVSETPTAFGFGDSTLNLSRFYRLKPKTLDGASVVGEQVEISIDFTPPR
ncbi:energy transducer TonB [Caulobacter segnis]